MSHSSRIQGQDAAGDVVPVRTDVRGRAIHTVHQESLTSDTMGPMQNLVSDNLNHILVIAPGVGFQTRVLWIQVSFEGTNGNTVEFKSGVGGQTRIAISSRKDDSLAPLVFDPPWLLDENTAFVAIRTEGIQDVRLNYHYYVDTAL